MISSLWYPLSPSFLSAHGLLPLLNHPPFVLPELQLIEKLHSPPTHFLETHFRPQVSTPIPGRHMWPIAGLEYTSSPTSFKRSHTRLTWKGQFSDKGVWTGRAWPVFPEHMPQWHLWMTYRIPHLIYSSTLPVCPWPPDCQTENRSKTTSEMKASWWELVQDSYENTSSIDNAQSRWVQQYWKQAGQKQVCHIHQ